MRQWRVGTISMGFLLIVLGTLLLGNTLWDISIENILFYGWPVILILLGLEVLLYSFFRKDGQLRFDFFSIFVLMIALMFTFVVYSVQSTGIFPAIRGAINDESYTVDIQESLNIPANIKEIEIEAPNGEFEITGTKANTADIVGTIRVSAENQTDAEELIDRIFTVKTVGDKAIIRIESLSKENWFNTVQLKADLKMKIPQQLYLNTNLINGDIQVSSMANAGVIDGVNGTIRLNDSQGDFEVSTVNGRIYVDKAAGNLEINTTNGEIQIREAFGKLEADAVNGKIDANSSKVNGNWELTTVNGDIDITIPDKADAKILGKSSIGKVNGDLSWVDKNKDAKLGSEREAVLGGGKYAIELQSQHGEIEVNLR